MYPQQPPEDELMQRYRNRREVNAQPLDIDRRWCGIHPVIAETSSGDAVELLKVPGDGYVVIRARYCGPLVVSTLTLEEVHGSR